MRQIFFVGQEPFETVRFYKRRQSSISIGWKWRRWYRRDDFTTGMTFFCSVFPSWWYASPLAPSLAVQRPSLSLVRSSRVATMLCFGAVFGGSAAVIGSRRHPPRPWIPGPRFRALILGYGYYCPRFAWFFEFRHIDGKHNTCNFAAPSINIIKPALVADSIARLLVILPLLC